MAPTFLFQMKRADLEAPNNAPAARITGAVELSSYNWVGPRRCETTIVVPGAPDLWHNAKGSSLVPKDVGFHYVSQNAARHPDSPLEPLFRSLYITRPFFDLSSVDIVSDRNNIRKLLSFVDSSTSGKGSESFTISVELVGETIVFKREERATTDYIQPHEFKGYGHNFERSYTIRQVEGSTGHHRIISYSFGGMKLLVRYEADGYIKSEPHKSPATHDPTADTNLSSMLGAMSLSQSKSVAKHSSTYSKLVVEEGGEEVLPRSTLEIKTRVAHKQIGLNEVMPQLWVSQTTKLVRAYHQNGWFFDPQVEDIAEQMGDWEDGRQGPLRKLAALLRSITVAAKACNGYAVLQFDKPTKTLTMTQVEGKPFFPADLYERWERERRVRAEAVPSQGKEAADLDSHDPVVPEATT